MFNLWIECKKNDSQILIVNQFYKKAQEISQLKTKCS